MFGDVYAGVSFVARVAAYAGLAVFVPAPRPRVSVAVERHGVPPPQAHRLKRFFELYLPRRRDPLLVRVQAEGVVRVPAPRVRRPRARARRRVAAPRDERLLARGSRLARDRVCGDGLARRQAQGRGRGDVPVGVGALRGHGRGGQAELAVLAAAPLRDGRRDGEGATNEGATREGVVRNEGGQRVAQHGGGTARGSARRLRRRTTKMTSSAGSSISTVFVMMKRRFGATGWSLFRGDARAADSSKVRIDPAPLAAKWIKMAIVRATLRGTVARAAP